MPPDTPVKALIIAFTDAPALAGYVINRLQPELLCFFVPESAKAQVEEAVQPLVRQMPKRWDWVVTPDAADVIAAQVGSVVHKLHTLTLVAAAALAAHLSAEDLA